MQAGVRSISPLEAEAFLACNTKNRRLQTTRVQSYAEAMKRGEWAMSNDAITFDVDGKLLNGQHRLSGVVESGKTVDFLVVEGLDPKAQELMDDGAKRRFCDVLTLRGEVNTATLASAIRYAWLYKETGSMRKPEVTPSKPQLLAFLEAHPGIRDAIRLGTRQSSTARLTPTIAGALYYLFAEQNAADAEEFFVKLGSGEGLAEGDPILVLRNQLLRDAMKHSRNRNTPKYIHAAWAIKAFNAWREGRSIKLLVYRAGGAGKEGFPQIESIEYDEPQLTGTVLKADSVLNAPLAQR